MKDSGSVSPVPRERQDPWDRSAQRERKVSQEIPDLKGKPVP